MAERSLVRSSAWSTLAMTTLLCTLFSAVALAQQPCLKLVFNRYCLGGDLNALLQQGQPTLRQDEGERIALIYQEGPERVYVMGFRNRIYKVLRQYQIASQLRYDELYRLLRDKYGAGEDRSRFPGYATTPGRKKNAIRRGEGMAVHVWEVSGGWRVELAWTREMGLALAYVAEELDRQQQAVIQGGY